MGKLLAAITDPNGAVKDINELVQYKEIGVTDIGAVATVYGAVKNGDKIGFLKRRDALTGTNGAGCNPTYTPFALGTSEKEWKLGKWSIANKLCYEDIEGTIAQEMKSLMARQDVSGNTSFANIVAEAIDKDISSLITRNVWFGSLSATNISVNDTTGAYVGGTITDGLSADFFKTCEGIYSQLKAITTENSEQRTTIAANNEATIKLQYDKFLADGVATGILDEMTFNASAELQSVPDNEKMFIMGYKAWKAVQRDIKKNNKGSEAQYKELTEGTFVTKYDGIDVLVLQEFDNNVKNFCKIKGVTGKTEDRILEPHRIILMAKGNIGVTGGFDDVGKGNIVGNVTNGFDDKAAEWWLRANGELDVKVLDDKLIHYAY